MIFLLAAALAQPRFADPSATSAVPVSPAALPDAVTAEVASPWFGPADADAAVVAACPTGYLPVRGDVEIDGGDAMRLVGSYADAGVGWRAEVLRAEPSTQRWRVRVTATCVPASAWGRRGVTVDAVSPGLSEATAQATCPAGTTPVGGGGRLSLGGSLGAWIDGGSADGDAWTVSAAAPAGPAFPVTVGAQAMCWRR
jgi:hypothetical protein